MTEAKSPREIAAHRERLETHLKWLRGFPDTAIGQKTADAIESLLSYAAERERLLADADEVIAVAGRFPEGMVLRERELFVVHRLQAKERHHYRHRSRPATEGKREDD